MRRFPLYLLALIPACGIVLAQSAPGIAPDVAPFLSSNARQFALVHVRVIDGTGAPALEDQTVVISDGKIQSIEPSRTAQVSPGVDQRDSVGYSVMPGLVGMHDHLYMTHDVEDQRTATGIAEPGFFVAEIPYSAPRLYLAAGVTTMRTTGSVEPYADLRIKSRIDANQMPGPSIDVTAPYLEGSPTQFAQMHELTGTDDARHTVDFWVQQGATSFKAYMHISRDELKAAIEQAHAHKMKLTGHLCSVTWHEAIALGIDNLEHGPVYTDTDFLAGKKLDECPAGGAGPKTWQQVKVDDAQVQSLIRDLIDHHVAVTSTLPVFELNVPGRPHLQSRVMEAMSPDAKLSYLTARSHVAMDAPATALLRKEMDFEVAFVKAGGLLLAGPDPTGMGGVLPGFGDQREIELLVEAGFEPLQAIKIGTKNGADFLGRGDTIGTLAPGKQADMLLIKGKPDAHIEEIENVETVFKNGIGYDSAKLLQGVRGQVGIH